jgi:hypothetical protein
VTNRNHSSQRHNSFTATLICCALIWAVSLPGCGGSTEKPVAEADVEHHEHASPEHAHAHAAPADFAAGVATLKEEFEAIKAAFAAGKTQDAHDPLHEVAHLLEALPDLAKAAPLEADQAQIVQDAITKMFDAYMEIDGAMHEGAEPDYQAVAGTLDECMATLEAAAGK